MSQTHAGDVLNARAADIIQSPSGDGNNCIDLAKRKTISYPNGVLSPSPGLPRQRLPWDLDTIRGLPQRGWNIRYFDNPG